MGKYVGVGTTHKVRGAHAHSIHIISLVENVPHGYPVAKEQAIKVEQV